MRCKIPLLILVICLVVQAQDIVELQKFSEVKNQEVKFLFDTWKYHFGWKTLGGGYIRHILLITDESIVEIEMPEVSHTPGYSYGGLATTGGEPEEIFLNFLFNLLFYPLIEKILPDPYEKMRQELQNQPNSIKEKPTVENFVNFISDLYSKKGKKIKVANIYLRNSLKDLKLESKGDEIHLNFKTEDKKQSYISRYKDLKQKNEILSSLAKVLEVDEDFDE